MKGAIDICYQTRGAGSLAACDTFAEVGGTSAEASAGTNVASVAIDDTTNIGEVTATGTAAVDNHTYILTPTASSNSLTWAQTGSCIAAGVC